MRSLPTHKWRVVQRPIDVLLVLIDARAPREVGVHPPALHTSKGLRLAVESVEGGIAHLLELVDVQWQDTESGRNINGFHHHRVLQAPTQRDDRHAAIALRTHLGKSAWLVAGGHQEQVAARVHDVLQLRVERASRNSAGPLPRFVADVLNMALVAVPHEQDLHIARHSIPGVGHHPIERLANDVDTFLHRQAPDKGNENHVWVCLQAHPFLQLHLACALAFDEGSLAIVDLQQRVRPRVP
mmetsp:Transcript_35551/g.102424  ORF Transcript_35551/g.102424 Transcript_35551/m.102424 type:complete len:241 (-) Transcript_35551:1146-1868(-)